MRGTHEIVHFAEQFSCAQKNFHSNLEYSDERRDRERESTGCSSARKGTLGRAPIPCLCPSANACLPMHTRKARRHRACWKACLGSLGWLMCVHFYRAAEPRLAFRDEDEEDDETRLPPSSCVASALDSFFFFFSGFFSHELDSGSDKVPPIRMTSG